MRDPPKSLVFRGGGSSVVEWRNKLAYRSAIRYFRPGVDAPMAEPVEGGALGLLPEPVPITSVASYDPVLICLTNLTARLLNCRRAMITVVSASKSYLIAESTQSLSLNSPHTHDPGDQLWLGCGTVVPIGSTLCELTVGLIPSPDDDRELIFEVNDLAEDPVYREAPFVTGWPYKRYYCAAPLRTPNGVSIGTLCVFDENPRPDGSSEDQKMTLSNMSDIVMNYLETKQGKRSLEKSSAMELGLSRFIAEGFLPAEGIGMTERRDGRLLERKELEARRLKEMDRKKMVERKRTMLQQRKFAEMMRDQNADDGAQQQSETTAVPETTTRTHDSKGMSTPQHAYLCMNLDIPEDTSEMSLMDTMTFPSTMPRPLPSPSPETHSAYRQSDTLLTPPASTSSYFSGKCDDNHYFDGAYSSTQSCSGASENLCRRQSAYEKTSSFEPQFRAMFFRAATLIRSSIDAEVVFLDGDLEGFFGPEDCDKPNSCGRAHISTDKEAEQATRAERPKACRRRSGILGYATSNGSSNSQGESHSIEDLGFDVAELNEEILNKLVEENDQGRIVARVDDSEDTLEETRSQGADGTQTDAILWRFLPGAKSVILVPLFDPNHKLFAVCFAWTTSTTKTYSSEVEGSFVAAVANCIMAESTRLAIFNGVFLIIIFCICHVRILIWMSCSRQSKGRVHFQHFARASQSSPWHTGQRPVPRREQRRSVSTVFRGNDNILRHNAARHHQPRPRFPEAQFPIGGGYPPCPTRHRAHGCGRGTEYNTDDGRWPEVRHRPVRARPGHRRWRMFGFRLPTVHGTCGRRFAAVGRRVARRWQPGHRHHRYRPPRRRMGVLCTPSGAEASHQ